ncbi:putative ribosome recycling factor [Candidatus Hodgkinia cicadicola Dsem]|nr:putative ribosome recycling factor [Candidatus Hodgkinia cicadicola Dsem]
MTYRLEAELALAVEQFKASARSLSISKLTASVLALAKVGNQNVAGLCAVRPLKDGCLELKAGDAATARRLISAVEKAGLNVVACGGASFKVTAPALTASRRLLATKRLTLALEEARAEVRRARRRALDCAKRLQGVGSDTKMAETKKVELAVARALSLLAFVASETKRRLQACAT